MSNGRKYFESAKRVGIALLFVFTLACTAVLGWFALIDTDNLKQRNARKPPEASHAELRVFSYRAFHKLAESRLNDDLVYSPISLQLALMMLSTAANGETQAQIEAVIDHFPPPIALAAKSAIPELTVANRLWLNRDYDLRDSFIKATQSTFGVMPALVDFKGNAEIARQKINQWTAAGTRGVIDQIAAPGTIDNLTQFMLTSAATFDSRWQQGFRKEQTTEDEFTTALGAVSRVPMMHGEVVAGYTQDEHVQVLELPFANPDLVMLIVLPKQVNGLTRLESHFVPDTVNRWVAQLRESSVIVTLPKFTISKNIALPILLSSLGMELAFDPMKADFSGFTGQVEMYLSNVVHKTHFVVSEDGLQRPESTPIITGRSGRAVIFKANHPFVFLVRHKKTNSMVIMGHLANPKEGAIR